MTIIEIIYITAATIAISACVPQVRRLLQTKKADGFHLRTWMTWTLTQLATLLYVVTMGDWLMLVVNTIWVTFYATMSILILRYRLAPVVDTQVPQTIIAAQLQE